MDVSDVALAVDLIDEIGPDGQYLDHKHTWKHFRSRRHPDLLDRNNYDTWLAQGGTMLQQRAAERIEAILSEHKLELLSKDVAQAVHALVERAEAAYGRG